MYISIVIGDLVILWFTNTAIIGIGRHGIQEIGAHCICKNQTKVIISTWNASGDGWSSILIHNIKLIIEIGSKKS